MRPVRFKQRRSKYNAKAVVVDGMRFDSKKEAEYYRQLKIQQEDGSILFFLRQTPFHLPGGVKLVLDFIVFYVDGLVRFVDVKGMRTDTYKVKKRIVEDVYGIEIEEV